MIGGLGLKTQVAIGAHRAIHMRKVFWARVLQTGQLRGSLQGSPIQHHQCYHESIAEEYRRLV